MLCMQHQLKAACSLVGFSTCFQLKRTQSGPTDSLPLAKIGIPLPPTGVLFFSAAISFNLPAEGRTVSQGLLVQHFNLLQTLGMSAC